MSIRWLIATIAALSLVVVACANPEEGGGDGDTATTVAAPEEETTTTGDADTTTTADGGEAVGETPYEHLNAALNGDLAGTSVTVNAQWIDAEEENILSVLTPFEEATGIDITYEGLTDYETVLTVRVEGGDAPDIAQIAQPGKMQQFAAEGQLVAISDWINMDQIRTDYIESFVDLGSFEGDMYGLFFKGDLKSIVWYPVQAFEDAGYEIPATWDDLVALSDQIIADTGTNPWCISIEHGDASGWVATDWMEDILLRTAPPEIYDQWTTHEIPFNDPEVLEAADYMSQIWFGDDYVYGGSTAINATFVGDTQTPMFSETGPECWFHKQAAWIPGFWPEGTEAGFDSSFFYFPPIEEEFGNPVLGGGDQWMMFDDRPEVRALIEYLATPEGAQPWIERGGFVSPNSSVPLDWYATYPNDELAAILAEADTFRFDASDAMPTEVGGGSFWQAMIDWVAADGEGTEDLFQTVEDSWPAG
jgi:alpha-glucoside transport system substrate-binding protein